MAFPPASVATPTLTPWQVSYGGLTMGNNTAYELVKIEGLDMPNIRTGDAGRARDHGMFIGLDLMADREVTLTGQMLATPGSDAWQDFANATPPGNPETPFYLNVPPFGTIGCMARVRRRNMPLDFEFAAAYLGNFTLQFSSSDPRLYQMPTQSQTVALPTPSGGFSFPLTFPLTFGYSTGSVILAINNGNIEMRPVLTITGPCTSPQITNASINGNPTITFDLTMATGDQLVIDTDMHTATFFTAGTTVGSSRMNTLQAGSTWWTLPVGANTLQFLSKDRSLAAGTLRVEYAPAMLL